MRKRRYRAVVLAVIVAIAGFEVLHFVRWKLIAADYTIEAGVVKDPTGTF